MSGELAGGTARCAGDQRMSARRPGLPGRSGGRGCRLVAVELQEVVGGGYQSPL